MLNDRYQDPTLYDYHWSLNEGMVKARADYTPKPKQQGTFRTKPMSINGKFYMKLSVVTSENPSFVNLMMLSLNLDNHIKQKRPTHRATLFMRRDANSQSHIDLEW